MDIDLRQAKNLKIHEIIEKFVTKPSNNYYLL